jgi:1-acyl-sn-glycerol-3-phosphate acyltransferase
MYSLVNYCWRLIATGGCFAIFSFGGFLLWLLVFPSLRLFSATRRSERIRWVIHRSFRAFLRLMESVGIMRMEVDGGDRLRECGGSLVLANHPTLIDVVALVSLMPSTSCVVKEALRNDPFLGGVVRSAGYLSNSDADGLVEDCARDLRAGRPLIVFPEGTRTWPGTPLRFLRGAAYIALRSGAPVLPVLIDCQPSTLTRKEKWYQIPSRPFRLRIKVLDPFPVDRRAASGEAQTLAARRLTRALQEFFVMELAKWTR